MPVARTLSLKGKLQVPLVKIWNKNSASFLPKSNNPANTGNSNNNNNSTSKNNNSTSKINKTSPSKHNNNKHPQRWSPKVCTLQPTNEGGDDIVFLKRDEIQLGPILGEGGFAQVYGLFQCPPSLQQKEEEETSQNYAVKVIRRELFSDTNQKLFQKAADDLVHEAQVLAQLNHHPHIISLRGLPQDCHQQVANPQAFSHFFLVLDRLEETLADRIQLWKDLRQASSSHAAAGGDSTMAPATALNETSLMEAKIHYALQLAQAMEYLHQHRILIRDLKPENIGFQTAWRNHNNNSNGSNDTDNNNCNHLQLFDFGFARQLPPSKNTNNNKSGQEEFFHFTNICGTQRYMANEVLVDGHYSLKSDVYSWAMVVWEIFAEKKPFHYLTPSVHKLLVCQNGDRPPLSCYGVPEPLQKVLQTSWAHKVEHRLSMAKVSEQLQLHFNPNVNNNVDHHNANNINNNASNAKIANHDNNKTDRQHLPQKNHGNRNNASPPPLQKHQNYNPLNVFRNIPTPPRPRRPPPATASHNHQHNSNNKLEPKVRRRSVSYSADPFASLAPLAPPPLMPSLNLASDSSNVNESKGHRRSSSSSAVTIGAPPPLAPLMPTLNPDPASIRSNNNIHETKEHRRSSSSSSVTSGAPPPLAPPPPPPPMMPSLNNKEGGKKASSIFQKRSMSFDTKDDSKSSPNKDSGNWASLFHMRPTPMDTKKEDNSSAASNNKDNGKKPSFFQKRSMAFDTKENNSTPDKDVGVGQRSSFFHKRSTSFDTKEDSNSAAPNNVASKDGGKFASLFHKRSTSFDILEDCNSATLKKDGGPRASLFYKRSSSFDAKEDSNSAAPVMLTQSNAKEQHRGDQRTLSSGRLPAVVSPIPPLSPTRRAPLSPTGRAPLSPTGRAPLSPTRRAPLSPTRRAPLSPTGRAPLSPSGRAPLSPTGRAPLSPTKQIEIQRDPPRGSHQPSSSGSPQTVVVSPPASPYRKKDSGMSNQNDLSMSWDHSGGGGGSDVPSSTYSSSHLSRNDKEGILNRAKQLFRRDKAKKHQRTSSGTPPLINLVSPPQSPGVTALYNQSWSSWDQGAGGSHSSNDGDNTRHHSSNHHSSTAGPSLMDLQERKRELKEQLKQYDIAFAQKHGRMPSKSEKESIRPLYNHYNGLKGHISTLESLKKQLRAYDKLYASEHGRTPSQPEKQMIRCLYEEYKAKKRVIVEFLADFEDVKHKKNEYGAAFGATGRRRHHQPPHDHHRAANFTTLHSFDSDLTPPERMELGEL